MRVPGWSPAALVLAACLWQLPPGRGAAAITDSGGILLQPNLQMRVATGAVIKEENGGTEEVIVGEAGKNITLVCRNASQRAGEVDWFHGDPTTVPPLFSSNFTLPKDVRFSLVDSSSLRITALRLQDQGNYTCKEVLNQTAREHRLQLLVASGPSNVTVSISPSTLLPNGTAYVDKHNTVHFSCTASDTHPEPTMEWIFQQPGLSPEMFTKVNGSSTVFTLQNLSLDLQGNYTCTARNPLSGSSRTSAKELLVYYPPPSVPRCWAQTAQVGMMLQLVCSWPGGYPHPILQWTEEEQDLENSSWVVNATGTGDTHVETLNSSRLFHGKEFKCVGSHILGQGTEELTCTVQIKTPSLVTEPLKTCFVGGTVILTCRVTESNPPARISWLRNLSHPELEIQPGGRYLLVQEGSVSNLTIQNCSHGIDEGYYVCKAENPVGLREVYVSLTVKKPVNIVGVVGAVVILLLLGILVISGIILYYNPLLCLKGSMFR
ncbi:V-set and immunoglobulin domain-containing protein 10 isoform X1 [Pelodiscus sinensis]|uniref:V-set and immunoglobulin domain-containing protein 10 isoform X1 n=1 Tax=Pelodiscus sinensis TaxID=13735 RepID=UPI003F6AA0B7